MKKGQIPSKLEITKPDPKFVSAPSVNEIFSQDSVTIVGNFKIEEAKSLADILNAGALPVQLDEIYSTSVGAQFGEKALDETIFAGVIGIAAVFLFMIFYYRLPGVISTITLTVYLFLVLLTFDLMNVVLTLPGIAALILGVGMAVDANIITAERYKEEIKVGKSIKAAFKAGNENSLSTVTDANLTTLLAAAVLFYYGTSSVKGFATSLIIGILLSFITNVFLSRWLTGLFVHSGWLDQRPGWFGVKKSAIHDLKENVDTLDLTTRFDRFDFVTGRKKSLALFGTILVIGLIVLSIFKLNLSIDFASGTRVDIMANEPLTAEVIENELTVIDQPSEDILISGDEKNIGVVHYKGALAKDEIAEIKTHFQEKFGIEPNINSVSSVVGKELVKNAIVGIIIASAGMILYVTIRFEWRMAVAAVIALLYAALFVIPVFSITQTQVDLTFIAALLTIIGYAINDTIVTFDRMRENLTKRRRIKTFEDIADVANTSVRQTLGRSVNTVAMTIVPVIAIMLFGSESLFGFSLALTVGLVVGTFTTIFVAIPIWIELKHRELKKKGVIVTYKEKRVRTDEPVV